MGYYRAGFEVVGVDINPQPHYPFDFIQADALAYDWLYLGVDAIHASPPCQLFSIYRNNHKQNFRPVENHIPATREMLKEWSRGRPGGRPWVIENVPRAPLVDPVQYCGTSFPPLEVRRHRLFESNVPLEPPPCDHGRLTERKYPGSTNRPNGRTVCNIGEYRVPVDIQRKAIGIPWMDLGELAEAIPPAYTEHIGKQILAYIKTQERA